MGGDLAYAAAFVMLLAAILGFLILIVVLVVDGNRRLVALTHRRPRPYPGCAACSVALADDCADPAAPGGSLDRHQAAEHTGGVRW